MLKNAYFGFSISGKKSHACRDRFALRVETLLYKWSMGDRMYFPFLSPMHWRETRNHINDYFSYLTNVVGKSSKNYESLKYPEVSSVSKPVPRYKDQLPVFLGTNRRTKKSSNASMMSGGSEVVIIEKHLIMQSEQSEWSET